MGYELQIKFSNDEDHNKDNHESFEFVTLDGYFVKNSDFNDGSFYTKEDFKNLLKYFLDNDQFREVQTGAKILANWKCGEDYKDYKYVHINQY